METNTLTIKVKGKSKFSFLIQLLEQLGFVDVEVKSSITKVGAKHDFFKSAGLWKDREINAQELREQAWNRKK
jgi:hypothetical protein